MDVDQELHVELRTDHGCGRKYTDDISSDTVKPPADEVAHPFGKCRSDGRSRLSEVIEDRPHEERVSFGLGSKARHIIWCRRVAERLADQLLDRRVVDTR